MKKKRSSAMKKLIAILITAMMLTAMLPLSALAEAVQGIIFHEQEASGYIYAYGGNSNPPSPVSGSPLNNVVTKAEGDIGILQYQIYDTTDTVEPVDTIWTYCSDIAIKPQVYSGEGSRLYQRIPIESVGTGDGFFGGAANVIKNAARLRAILMHSDLWLEQDADWLSKLENEANAWLTVKMPSSGNSIDGLTKPEVVAATQIAIWHIANNIEPLSSTSVSGAFRNSNVRAFYTFLLGLEGVSAAELARIDVTRVEKTVDNGKIVVSITYGVAGDGAEYASGDIAVSAYYMDGSNKVPVGHSTPVPSADGKTYTTEFNPVAIGKTLMIDFASTQRDVDSVYLYATENRANSQTLVSVVKDVVELKSTLTVNATDNLAGITIYKDWYSSNDALVSNSVVEDYTSTFRFTYANGELKDRRVIEDLVLEGNDERYTGDYFEITEDPGDPAGIILFKVQETGADIGATAGDGVTYTPPGSVSRYFYITGDFSAPNVVWTDENGVPTSVPNQSRFVNTLSIETGSATVTKTVTGAGGDEDKYFTFTATLLPSGSGAGQLLANTQYTVGGEIKSTNGDGEFELKHGQTAQFTGLPVGTRLHVSETTVTGYDVNAEEQTTGAVNKNAPVGIEFVNTYKTGELVITKTFKDGDLDWGAFNSEASAITVTIQNENDSTFSRVAKLYKNDTEDHSTVTVTLPVGTYTLTESTVDGYEMETTISVGSDKTSGVSIGGVGISYGGTTNVGFENSYRELRGNLTVKKTAVDAPSDQASKTYTFEVYAGSTLIKFDNDGNYDANGANTQIVLKNNESKTISGLKPGSYTVKELVSGAEITNYTLTVRGQIDSASSQPLTAVSGTYNVTAEVKDQEEKAETVVTFTNTYTKQSGKLIITKEFSGGVTQALAGGAEVAYTFEVYAGETATGTPVERVTLNKDKWTSDEITLDPGLYTIKETAPSGSIQYYTYNNVSYSDNDTDSATKSPTVRIINGATVIVTAKNNYTRQTGSVQFKKAVDNKNYDPSGETFTFTVTGDGVPGSYQTSNVEVMNGGLKQTRTVSFNVAEKKITVSGIMDGDIVTVGGLLYGQSVTITEAPNVNYTVKAGESATNFAAVSVPNGTVADLVTFTNTRQGFELTVQKVLIDGAKWSDFARTGEGETNGIRFEIKGPAGWYDSLTPAMQEKLSEVAGKEDTYTFWLYGAGTGIASIVFANVPAGVYEVTEIVETAEVEHYTRTTKYSFDYKAGAWETGVAAQDGGPAVYDPNKQGAALAAKPTITFMNDYDHKTGVIGIEKEVDIVNNPLEQYEFTVTFDKPFDLTALVVTGADLTEEPAGVGSSISFILIAGQKITISGIPTGTKCTITEKDNEMYTVTYQIVGSTGEPSESGEVEVLDTTQIDIKIINRHKTTGKLDVKKVLNATGLDNQSEAFRFQLILGNNVVWTGKYTVGSDTTLRSPDNDGYYTLTAGQTAHFENLPVGVSYLVTEADYTAYTTTYIPAGGTGTVNDGSGDAGVDLVTITNTRKTGDLTVSKAVSNTDSISGVPEAFEFILMYGTTPVANWDNITDADGRFTLEAGESVTFYGLPTGSYTVTEVRGGVALPNGVDWKVEYDTGAGNVIGVEAAVTHGTAGSSVEFTNTFSGITYGLTVKKEVKFTDKPDWDNTAVPTSFTLILKDSTGTPVVASYTTSTGRTDSTAADGVFTLADGETATFTGLQYGSYYVTENTASANGYSWAVTFNGAAEAGIVPVPAVEAPGAAPMITVVNEYTRVLGSLKVTKALTGELTNTSGLSFDFKLYYGAVADNVLVATFSLSPGGTKDFGSMPFGTYTLVETNKIIAGYELKSALTQTIVIEGAEDETFTNTYEREYGNLTISKAIHKDSVYKPAAWSYKFRITVPSDWTGDWTAFALTAVDGQANTYEFTLSNSNASKTFKGLPGGNYTITEVCDSAEYNHKITWNGGTAISCDVPYEVSLSKAGATIAAENLFTIRGAELTVKKYFDGISSNVARSFTFEYIKLDGNGNIPAGAQSERITISVSGDVNSSKSWETTVQLPEGDYLFREITGDTDSEKFTFIDKYTFSNVVYTFGNKDAASENKDTGGWIRVPIVNNANIVVCCTNYYIKDGAILRVTKDVDGYAGNGDTFWFKITSSEGALPSMKYDVEVDGETVGDDSSEAGGIFKLGANQTAVFYGLSALTDYTVTELTDSMRGVYTFDTVEGRSFMYSLGSDGEGRKYTILGDPAEIGEGNYSVEGAAYTTGMGAKSGDAFPGLDITFTNARNTGSLVLTKSLKGAAHNGDPYEIYVTFKEGGTPVANLSGLLVNGSGAVCDENGRLKLLMYPGIESAVTIGNIPAGLTYTVTEAQGSFRHYDVSYDGDTGTIANNGGEYTCTIVNTRLTGSLNVTKYVTATGKSNIDKSEPFLIKVSFWANGSYGDIDLGALLGTDDNYFSVTGVADNEVYYDAALNRIIVAFSATHETGVSIARIPVGLLYDVTETLDGQDEYVSYIGYYDGVIDPPPINAGTGDSKVDLSKESVSVTNFLIPRNSIAITKDVKPTNGSYTNTMPFEFTLELIEPVGEVTGSGKTAYEQMRLTMQTEKISAEIAGMEARIAGLADEIAALQSAFDTDYGADYDALLASLNTLLAAYNNDQSEEYLAIVSTVAAGEHGRIACTACGGDRVTEAGCPDHITVDPEGGEEPYTCPNCDGDGFIRSDCYECDELGTIADPAALAAAVAAAIDLAKQAAEDEFAQQEAVVKYGELQELMAEPAKLAGYLDKARDILETLESGVYVAYDSEYGITNDDDEGNYSSDELPLILDDGQIFAKGPNNSDLTLDDISFTRDMDNPGVYHFWLRAGETLIVTELPEGTRFKVTESGNINAPEPFEGCEITITKGDAAIDEEEMSVSGTISAGEDNSVAVVYLNKFGDAFGSITVNKVWSTGTSGSVTSITVTLLKNGEAVESRELTAEKGWSTVFGGLELGHSYSVIETVPDGYTVVYGNNEIEVLLYENKDSEIVTITNTPNPGPGPGPSPGPGPDPSPDPEPEPTPEPEPEPETPPETEIPDTTPPVAELPPEAETPPEFEIEDEVPPLGDIPQTGDTMSAGLAGICFLGAMAAAGALLITGKKRKAA